MRIAGTFNPADVTPDKRNNGKAAILAAFEAGYTLFDHADIYCRGICERIFGDTLRDNPSLKRSNFLIATKCGIRFPNDPPGTPHRYDFSREHIVGSCEQSLKRLQVDAVDIYQLHRPDLLMNPEEVAAAFDQLKSQGKVRYFGVSNFLPSFVSCLQGALPHDALLVNQVEIHLGRLDCFYDGTLDQCIQNHITPLAWSPLGGGFLGANAKVKPDHPRKTQLEAIQKSLDEIAANYQATRTLLALAWLLKHPSKMIPIVGSANPKNIREAAKADNLDITREDWYRILVAARGAPLP
jgi:predicted oxidoreductase